MGRSFDCVSDKLSVKKDTVTDFSTSEGYDRPTPYVNVLCHSVS